MLRLFAQNRLSASLVVLLLVGTVGVLSSVWTGALKAGTWTSAVLMIHAIIVNKCVLASFGQGSNAIKSAEQGAGLGLPIAKSLVDLHGGTFTLKSKLRIGTEVIVTFPPERVMSALAPLAEPAPSIEPAAGAAEAPSAPADVKSSTLRGLLFG